MTSRLQARLLAQRALFQRLQSSKKRNKLQSGFTLIELLIVVVILGILSAIGVPALINQQNKAVARANDSTAMGAARSCAAAIAGGDATDYVAPTNAGFTGATCALNSTFVSNIDATKASAATATVTADGAVELTTPSNPV